jgi:hypothetical protein
MAHDFLQTKQEIYEELRDSLSGRITKLTNFTDRSFNYVWTQSFSQELRELQELALVSELAGFIDYTGGPVTEDDIRELELEDEISADRVNELMQDQYLDEYVKIVGISRDEGTKATGTVTFQTQSAATSITSGTRVTTSPDADGDRKDYVTTEDASTSSNETTVNGVSIEAVETGETYNVPANTITRINNPPVGVTGVTNPASTTGGEDEETNDELRERAKGAVGGASEGGTVEGIKAYIRNTIDAVGQGDVLLEEFVDECPPYVDVIVDGGSDTDASDAIEFSRPAGIRHNLVRPEVVQLSANVDLVGSDIETTTVSDDIEDFLLELGLGENFFLDQFIREIMLSDSDIITIDNIDSTIERVTNELFVYSESVDSAIADDGGTTTDETVEANNDDPNDITLLPSSPSTGDAYYFGEDTVLSDIEIDISQAGAGTWNVVWEYYNGSSWKALSNVTDGTSDFQNAGANVVSWDVPSDWVATEVLNNQPHYYVRARLDTFSSISTQPLGQEINVTGSSYRLNYTYEDTNGSITVTDEDGNTYDENTDFIVTDQTGDGWKETIVWDGSDNPTDGQTISVDYDVTVIGETKQVNEHDTDVSRDEAFTFKSDYEDSFDFNNSDISYELTYVPFYNSTSIVDEFNTSYTQGTDWQLAPLQDFATKDVLTYSTGTDKYSLTEDYDFGDVAVIDADGNIYVEGNDYQMTDEDGDGFDDTIDWSLGGSTPADSTDFTVNYNAFNNSVRWDTNNSTPAQDDTFTVTYDQVYYETEYEIVETEDGQLSDSSGNTYDENTDYILIDQDQDDEDDGIYWSSNPSSLGDGEEFFFTYFTEGDLLLTNREKADPGTISVQVK